MAGVLAVQSPTPVEVSGEEQFLEEEEEEEGGVRGSAQAPGGEASMRASNPSTWTAFLALCPLSAPCKAREGPSK